MIESNLDRDAAGPVSHRMHPDPNRIKHRCREFTDRAAAAFPLGYGAGLVEIGDQLSEVSMWQNHPHVTAIRRLASKEYIVAVIQRSHLNQINEFHGGNRPYPRTVAASEAYCRYVGTSTL